MSRVFKIRTFALLKMSDASIKTAITLNEIEEINHD